MGYCTVGDVRGMLKDDMLNAIIGNEYIEDAGEREKRMEPIIQQAISDADAEIDGYLNKRYSVPITPPTKVIVKFSKDIAVYNLVSRLGIDADTREKTFKDRYDAAVRFLLEVSKGTVEIGAGNMEGTPRQPTGDYRVRSNQRLFSRDSMKGW